MLRMTGQDVSNRPACLVAIGASAGGVEALVRVVRSLPADLPAAICVVLHVPPVGTSHLPAILARSGPLPASHARDGEPLASGHIYVAPPDRHLLVGPDRLHVVNGPRENLYRPAVDPLFRSAASAFGRRSVGVILSGTLDDGTAGLLGIARAGGATIVQDPHDALFPGMPLSACLAVEPDLSLPADEIGPAIGNIVSRSTGHGVEEMTKAEQPAEGSAVQSSRPLSSVNEPLSAMRDDPRAVGKVSQYGCPECGGVLWELDDEPLLTFRCRVGHAFSGETLLSEQGRTGELELWSALRAHEEEASLATRLSERLQRSGHRRAAERFDERRRVAEEQASRIEGLLSQLAASSDPESTVGDERIDEAG